MLAHALLAAAALTVHVDGWSVLRINGEAKAARPGAVVPICQAINITALTARLRASVPGRSVRVRLVVPGHRPRYRSVRLRRRTRVMFTPRDLRLRDELFPEGTYRLAVRRRGRVLDRAVLHVRGGGFC